MAVILITGGSGMIGRRLTKALLRDGHQVRWLSRRSIKEPRVHVFRWNVEEGRVDKLALADVDHIVHLSGEGIADKRWTAERMKALYLSRTGAAQLLLKAALSTGSVPRSFISASGVGYYGAITSDHVFTENDAAATDTIGKLTADWERAADDWSAHCRVVKLRVPFVIAREGLGVKKMALPARWGLSTALGGGDQWMPWVHIDDLVRLYQLAITDEGMHGAYNTSAPDQPDNKTFMKTLAQVLHRPFFLPNVPAFALKLVFGELSCVVLHGSRTSQVKLHQLGFEHRFKMLRDALGEALS